MHRRIKLKNILFGIFLLIVGADIYFGEPFYSKGMALDRNIGFLFGACGLAWIIYELMRKKQFKKKNWECNHSLIRKNHMNYS